MLRFTAIRSRSIVTQLTRCSITTTNNIGPKIALLIDGDNAESSLIGQYIAEAGKFGKVTMKRVYADFTTMQMSSWREPINYHSLRAMQKFAFTSGKNSTDTALIIDAMDLLHSKKVDGFCIVSSDSDYTGLAQRIREEGLFVMGIGRNHTPVAFVRACETFTYSELLLDSSTECATPPKMISSLTGTTGRNNSREQPKAKISTRKAVVALVDRAFKNGLKKGDLKISLPQLFLELRKIDPLFSHRKFGSSKFRQFCDTLKPFFETEVDDKSTCYISRGVIVIDSNVVALVDRAFKNGLREGEVKMPLPQLLKELYKIDHMFDQRHFGSSRLRKFCDALKPYFVTEVDDKSTCFILRGSVQCPEVNSVAGGVDAYEAVERDEDAEVSDEEVTVDDENGDDSEYDVQEYAGEDGGGMDGSDADDGGMEDPDIDSAELGTTDGGGVGGGGTVGEGVEDPDIDDRTVVCRRDVDTDFDDLTKAYNDWKKV